jgi:hypothetical protein
MDLASKKELKFIHISKCAGTSIEKTGLQHDIKWGRYHKEYGWWHGIFTNIPTELKHKYDWFVVVRNPYSRILSELYCTYTGICKTSHVIFNNKTLSLKQHMNDYLINKIKTRKLNGDHYTEQYKYIDNTVTIHILKFENLEQEFKQLMNKYNIKINNLLKLNTRAEIQYSFELSDFSIELINLINTVYKKDFEMFNYEMKTKL